MNLARSFKAGIAGATTIGRRVATIEKKPAALGFIASLMRRTQMFRRLDPGLEVSVRTASGSDRIRKSREIHLGLARCNSFLRGSFLI